MIRYHFRGIHAGIARIEAAEKVPLPDKPDVVVDYKHLVKLEERGELTHSPEGADRPYLVRELLDGVEDARDPEVREHRKAMLAVQRGVGESAHAPGDTFVFNGPVGQVGVEGVSIDNSQHLHTGDITGSVVNLGEIKNSVVKSIAQMPVETDDTVAQLKPLLEKLTGLLASATEQGLDEQVAAVALDEVKAIADAAQKPDDAGFLPKVRRTLYTLRGLAEDLKSVPEIATQYMGYVTTIAALLSA